MITTILSILGMIPGLATAATGLAGVFYNAKVAITTAQIGGDRDVAVAMVAGATAANHERTAGLAIIASNKLLTCLVLAFAAPLVVFEWKVVVYDIVLGLGTTDAIRGQVADWANTIIISIFGSATGLGLASIGASYFKRSSSSAG